MHNTSNHDQKAKKAGAVAVMFGVAAAAVAAAYFLYGTEQGKKQRKKMGKVAHKMKEEFDENVTEKAFDGITRAWKKMEGVQPEDVEKAKKKLRGEWSRIEKELREPKEPKK